MKRTTLIRSILAAGILAAPALSLNAWDRVIDFQNFEVGDYHGPDDNPINAEAIHITRDEGWEGTQSGGAGVQRIRQDANGNKYYMLHTLGRGSSWSHVFSLVNFTAPFSDTGTLYWEFVTMGPSNEFIVGAAGNPATPVNEGDEGYTPWGWTGMTAWGQTRTGIQKNINNVFNVMDSQWRPSNLEDRNVHLGVWYQVWQHIDVAANEYRMYINGGQFEEPTLQFVTIDDVDYEDLFFRGAGTTEIASMFINTLHGPAGNPNQGDPWFLNNIAYAEGEFTLDRPTGTSIALSPGVLLPTKWGFRQLNDVEPEDADAYLLNGLSFLGEFWGNWAPWLYSVDLGTWFYSSILVDSEGQLRDESSERHGQAASWNYVINTGSGVSETIGNDSNSENFLGWVYTEYAPWYWMYSIGEGGTWGYLAEGDLESDSAWVWMQNSSFE